MYGYTHTFTHIKTLWRRVAAAQHARTTIAITSPRTATHSQTQRGVALYALSHRRLFALVYRARRRRLFASGERVRCACVASVVHGIIHLFGLGAPVTPAQRSPVYVQMCRHEHGRTSVFVHEIMLHACCCPATEYISVVKRRCYTILYVVIVRRYVRIIVGCVCRVVSRFKSNSICDVHLLERFK